MTIRNIVTRAHRESGLIPVGGEVEAEEFAESLEILNSMLRTLFGNQLGEPLQDYYSPDYISGEEFPANFRFILNDTTPTELTLSERPAPGARLAVIDNLRNLTTYPLTIDANGRKIEGAAVVTLSTVGNSSQWFYRDDLADWVKVSDLQANGESPLPPEFDDLLITLLAYRINPRYGAPTADSSIEVLKRLQSQFRARYKQTNEQRSELGLLNLSHGNKRGYYFSHFNTGH